MEKLAIVCITYNHEKFIKDCLESFISQKTNFPFVAYVADDCSTDKTPEIIKEYAKNYPDIIKPVFREKNIGSIENFKATLNIPKTEYVAICEGDDYWCDPYKLQKQVNLLEENKEYSGCFHPVKVVFENNKKESYIYPSEDMMKDKTEISLKEELYTNFVQTNSVVYRWAFREKEFIDYFPIDIMPGDWYVHLLQLKEGNFAYLDEIMGVYRRHEKGLWYDAYNNTEALYLKYGLQQANFFYCVYKNIANSSNEYLNSKLLKSLKRFYAAYYKNGDFASLHKLEMELPELINKVKETISFENDYAKIKGKYKKYKKLFNTFLILFIVFFIFFIVSTGFILIKLIN